MIGTTVLHYRIEEKLGAGGMGEVYRAHDLKLDRSVALKFIRDDLARDPDARRRFEREGRALAALNHPGVGAVHGVEEADGRLFLVLAYIEGRSLEELLEEGPLPPERARPLLLRIAEGLQAAHRRGIVHRDIKTANIVVGEDDLPKIVDFGIALRGGDTRLTGTGVYAGTPSFMAPEVFRGDAADTRSDVFSLGVVFYEALTGRPPFTRTTPAAGMHAILNEDPAPFPGDLPAGTRALEPVVVRCLSKDPVERFPDAGAVADALRAPQTSSSEPVTAPARAGATRRRRWTVGVAAIVLAALGGWLVLRGSTPQTARLAGETGAPSAVAVLEFENVTGDPQLDWMKRGVAELLASALVQSPALDVFDVQRLSDLTANEPSKEGAKHPSFAFLARKGISRAIAGSILRSGKDLRVQGRIVNTVDGRPIHSYAVEGRADSGLFHLVGRLIPDLQVALEVNLSGDREAEAWLREITTTSVDAYRLYLRGHQALLASHWKEAAAACEKALELDSLFVAARTDLAGAYWNLGENAKLELTRAAMRRLRNRANHRERLRIDLLEAVVGNDPAGLVRAASQLTRLYPENRFYTYLLGRGYFTMQQYQRCLDTLRPLVQERYRWSWSYVLSARSAAHLGDSTTARWNFERGLEVTRGDPELAWAYVRFLNTTNDRVRARSVIDEGLRSPTLSETPAGEGALRLELAKQLAAGGDSVGARREIQKASSLIPREDEARAEADSLLSRFRLPRSNAS